MMKIYSLFGFIKFHELVVGIFIFSFSILLLILFLEKYKWITALPLGASWIGLLFIFDSLDRKILKKSFLPTLHTKKRFTKMVLMSIFFGLILDSFGIFFARLWYYPYFPIEIYLLLAPLAFIVYTFLLFEVYELVEKTLTRNNSSPNEIKETKAYKSIINFEFICGIFGYLISIKYLISLIALFKIPIIELQESTALQIIWWYPFAFLLSTFFIFEYASYKEGKKTLTLDFLQGNIYPIIAIIVASWISIIAIEVVNAPFQVWVFSNWPFNELQIFNIPVVALIWWPFQFFAFLAMFRSILSKREASIW